ncbi:MAG TPA: FtsX-like permease family protein [Bacteroidia bacterium]|jgi:lipoprotein-releasing system permease protein|nr:FtsX-like permease family protein [Bacteroidia bacterium]
MNLSLFIARRYLVSKKSHNAINIISGVALGGIAIGTMALIIVLSAFNGISNLVQSLYNSFGTDIQITAVKGKTFIPNGPKFQSVKQLQDVKYFTEVMQDKALLKYDDQQSLAVLKGVSTDFVPMTHFDTLVRDGSFSLNKGGVDCGIFGRGIASQLGIGQTNSDYYSATCYAPKRGFTHSSPNPEDAITEKHLFPAGTFSINDDFDYRYVVVSLAFARDLFDYHDSSVTSVEIGLAKNANTDKVKQQIAGILGSDFMVKDRFEQNELLFKTLKSEKLWTFIILVFILIIATFNIVGSLSMLILDKEKDIDILYNMGADMGSIQKIFMFEGMLITFIGTLIGLTLGTLICLIQIEFKVIHFNQGFVVDAYPVSLQLVDYLSVFGAVLVIGLLASWYPVRVFASKEVKKAA